MKKTGGLVILYLLASLPLFSQEVLELSPDAAVDYAIKGNLSLKNSAITLKQSERNFKNSWNVFLPSVKGTGSLGYSDRLLTESPAGYGTLSADPWSLGLGLSMNLPLNLSAAPGLKIARLQYEEGRFTWNQAVASVRRDVLKNYYSLLTLAANQELLVENADLADATLKTVQTKFDKGLVPETDLLKARVNAKQLRNAALNARAVYENTLMNFLLLLGFPPDTQVKLTGSLTAPQNRPDNGKVLAMIPESDAMKAMELNIQILEQSRETAAYSYLTPSLSLSLGWQGSADAPFKSGSWDKNAWNDALSFTLALSIPLDGLVPGSKDQTSLAAMNDAVESARNSYQLALAGKQTEIKGLLNNIANAERNSGSSLESYQLAQRNLELTQEAWRAGSRSLLEVQTSQTELLSAGQDYLESLYSWIGYLLDLEYAVGTPAGELP